MGFVFTEHSPSTTTYVRSGRGGAGNTFRAADLPSPSSTTTCTTTTTTQSPPPSSSSRRFFSGIGGAGNVHEADHARRPALLRSLEEAAPAEASPEPVVGYVGRGGAGNVYRRGRGSDAGSVASGGSVSSVGSSLSAKAKAWATRVTNF